MEIEYHLVLFSVTGREVDRKHFRGYPAEFQIEAAFRDDPMAASATVEKHFKRKIDTV